MKIIQGFTLIELLVVVAIFSILALLSIGNYFGSRSKAYDTRALSCASSLNRAVGIYKIDFPLSPIMPDISTVYGTPTAVQTYGTGSCDGMTLTSNPQPQGYQFRVRHPQGLKVFVVSEESIHNE